MMETAARIRKMSRSAFTWHGLLLLLLLGGCQKEAEIVTYRTDKPEAVQAANQVEHQAADAPAMEMPMRRPPMASSTPTGQKVRMFGAIVPGSQTAWFYKLTGPPEAVEKQLPTLTDFVAGVKYENDEPVWTLPSGWQQQAGNQFRFATLVIPNESGSLEMSVSALPGSREEVAQVVDNINRWRGQVGLAPLTAETLSQAGEDLSQETYTRKVGEETIYFVNLSGTQQDTGMRPPFAR